MGESAIAAAAASAPWLAGDAAAWRGANDRLGVAVVGVRGRGASHVALLAGRRDVRVLYVCDPDRRVGMQRAAEAARRQGGSAVAWTADLRRALDDPRVAAVTIAAPNHWHAVAAAWALAAGKHVYLEPPLGHTWREEERLAAAAAASGRVCQVGFQCRSSPAVRAAIAFLRSGQLGRVLEARAAWCDPPGAAGPAGRYPVPAEVDYDLWLGPAARRPLTRAQLHYTWRWQWDYGCGAPGAASLLAIDMARWGLGRRDWPARVLAAGRRAGPPDAGGIPNDLRLVFQYGDGRLVAESRAEAPPPGRAAAPVVTWVCEHGRLTIRGYRGGVARDRRGRVIRRFFGPGGQAAHMANFLECVRRRRLGLRAPAVEARRSSSLIHLGMLAYRSAAGEAESAADVREGMAEADPESGRLEDEARFRRWIARPLRPAYAAAILEA